MRLQWSERVSSAHFMQCSLVDSAAIRDEGIESGDSPAEIAFSLGSGLLTFIVFDYEGCAGGEFCRLCQDRCWMNLVILVTKHP